MVFISDISESISAMRDLSYGLLTDHYSWNNWYVVQVSARGGKKHVKSGYAAAELRTVLCAFDGLIFPTDQQSCLAIFNGGTSSQLSGLEDRLLSSLSSELEDIRIRILSVCNEPHEILMMISQLMDGYVPATTARDSTSNVFTGEIERYDDFMRVWETTSVGGLQRQKPMILVVDDDPLTRAIISHSMKRHYQFISAECATEAVRKHILFAPNIVFLDINLPDHNGFDLLRHLRTFDMHSQVVMFSSNSFVENRLKAFACGASGFIAKPFSKINFEHYIEQWQHSRARQGMGGVQ